MTALGLGDVAAFPFLDPPDRAVGPRRRRPARRARRARHRHARRPPPADAARPASRPAPGRSPPGPDGARGRAQRVCPRGDGHRRGAVDPGPSRTPGRQRSRRRTRPIGASRSRGRTSSPTSGCGTTCANGSRRCRRASSASCVGPSTSTTCGCASGRTSTASSARWPAGCGSGPAPRPVIPTGCTSRCSPGCSRTSACGTARPASSAVREAPSSRSRPGPSLAKKPPRWVMAAELVETNRLWGRVAASIQPEWAERLGSHLATRSYGEPRWDARRGAAVTTERVSLFGLPIVAGRTIGLDRVDRAAARAMFIRHALVEGDWHDAATRSSPENRRFVEEVRAFEDRLRSRDNLLDDEAVFAFYDRRVGSRRGVGPPLRPVVEAGAAEATGPVAADGGRPRRRRPRSTDVTTPTRGGRTTWCSRSRTRSNPASPATV